MRSRIDVGWRLRMEDADFVRHALAHDHASRRYSGVAEAPHLDIAIRKALAWDGRMAESVLRSLLTEGLGMERYFTYVATKVAQGKLSGERQERGHESRRLVQRVG